MRFFYLFTSLIGVIAIALEIILGMPTELEAYLQQDFDNSALFNTNEPNQKMQGVHLVEARQGDRDWELFADNAIGSQEQGNWDLRKVRVQFYKKMKTEFVVTGEFGKVDAKNKNIKLKGNVKTVSTNDYKFVTDNLVYNSDNRTLTSPDKVVMLGPQDSKGSSLELTGIGMHTTIADSKMRILQNVVAHKDLVNGRKMHLTSRDAEFSSQNKQARFTGDVKVQMDQINLEGPEVFFDYGEGYDWLKKLRVSGGAKLKVDDKEAESDGLQYETSNDKLTLTGHPKIKQNEDLLFGEQIQLLEGGNRVQVTKPRMKLKDSENK